MRDITSKQITLRTARAAGMILCPSETIEIIKANKLPKGNLFDTARAAGFLAAKNTQNLIPHCHPVSIDALEINFSYLHEDHEGLFSEEYKDKQGIIITAQAKSIGRTGIEMEVMTAVSVAALTIYDLLKPLGNKDIEISSIKLLEKTGGKSDKLRYTKRKHTAAVLVCSDSSAAGKRQDSSGILIQEMLKANNADISDYKIVQDDKEKIQKQIGEWVSRDIEFIFTTGGTGLGPRDHTVDAVKEIIERDAPGITEAMRTYGGMRTPLAMMSRSVAGSIGHTLIITLPGSSKGARECMEALLPAIFHARSMLLGGGH
jgi:cyclic pyranopterin monophosphate synthase